MAITAKPASGTYSLNAGATHAPDHLYMLDENSGTTTADIGTAAALDLTFAAAIGSGPDWITDATHGTVLDFITANSDRATNSSVSGLSGTITAGALVYLTAGSVSRCFGSWSDSSQVDRYASVQWGGDENLQASSRFDDAGNSNNTTVSGLGVWSWVMFRFSDSTIDVSIDGSAWDTQAVTKTGLVAAITAFNIGARYTSSSAQFYDDPIAAFAWWNSDKSDSDVAAIYNSGNIWTGMGIGSGAITLSVDKADLQPTTFNVPLSKDLPVTAAAFSTSAQSILGTLAMAVGTAALTPTANAVALDWQHDATDLTIDVAAAEVTFQPYAVEGRRGIPVGSASPTIAGKVVNLAYRHAFVEEALPTFAGQDLILEENHFFVRAAPTIAGKAIALHKGTPVISVALAFAPQDITLTLGGSTEYQIVAAELEFTPQDVGLQLTWSSAVDVAALSFTANNIDLQWQQDNTVNVAEAHPFLTPGDIILAQHMPLDSTAFSLAGQDQTFIYGWVASVELAEFSIDGQDIGFSLTFTLGTLVVPAEFTFAPQEITLFLGSGPPENIKVYQSSPSIQISLGAPQIVSTNISGSIQSV